VVTATPTPTTPTATAICGVVTAAICTDRSGARGKRRRMRTGAVRQPRSCVRAPTVKRRGGSGRRDPARRRDRRSRLLPEYEIPARFSPSPHLHRHTREGAVVYVLPGQLPATATRTIRERDRPLRRSRDFRRASTCCSPPRPQSFTGRPPAEMLVTLVGRLPIRCEETR
jgi:hypothetical protein